MAVAGKDRGRGRLFVIAAPSGAGKTSDSAEVIARRLRDAVGDMSHGNEFDYVVVNDDFERAVTDLGRIVEGAGEELAADRKSLKALLSELVG